MSTATVTGPGTASDPRDFFPSRSQDQLPQDDVARASLLARGREILDREIEFIPSRSFSYTRPYREPADLRPRERLTVDEERELFRRMNFCKYQASVLRGMLQPDNPSNALMDRIQDRLDEAVQIRNYLVQVFLRLSHAVARQLVSGGVLLDDLISEAHTTLLRAVEKFDADRGFRFSTYATHSIRRTIWHFLKVRHRDTKQMAFAASLPSVLDDRKWSPRYELQMREAAAQLDQLVVCLEPREQQIVRSRFGMGEGTKVPTLKELADQLGVSRERIRQLQHRAIRKLRVMAEDRGLEAPKPDRRQ